MKKLATILLVTFFAGLLIPEEPIIPVQEASTKDWNKDTFWYAPWGSSGVHKGVDIFASRNTPVIGSVPMLTLYRGSLRKGGKVIVALGPKWRIHYYAHLDAIDTNAGLWISRGEKIGSVGDSGNARGKQPHLHYSIINLIPRPWEIDTSQQGYKKAFYVNPGEYLDKAN